MTEAFAILMQFLLFAAGLIFVIGISISTVTAVAFCIKLFKEIWKDE